MPDYRRVVWEGRRWVVAAVLLFSCGTLAGLVAALIWPDEVLRQLQPFLDRLREVANRVATEASPVERTSIIFRNNGLAVLWMILFGMVPLPFFFGGWPAVSTVMNGALIGIVAGLGARVSVLAASPWTLLLGIVPHGIFELPALWLASAWGMKLGLAWLLPAARGQRLRVFGRSALEAGQIFVLASVLLVVAAAIEANVTPAVMRRFAPLPARPVPPVAAAIL